MGTSPTDHTHNRDIESLQLRVYPSPSREAPTLVYLPGIHGDWTLIAACREILRAKVRFVEMTYPRSTTWSLTDYAEAIEASLRREGIERAWLLGESFGSQVLWELSTRGQLAYDGLILAGGFVRYPYPSLLAATRWLFPKFAYSMLPKILPLYVSYARIRYRGEVSMIDGAREFVARRTSQDLRAIAHRLALIAKNDPRAQAIANRIPVHHLYGCIDPIVPWMPVARWLKRSCGALRGTRSIALCDHTVLATAARHSAEQICQWIE